MSAVVDFSIQFAMLSSYGLCRVTKNRHYIMVTVCVPSISHDNNYARIVAMND
jgi:hypothetical protein